MARLSRGGICYDLAETPFKAEINSLSYHFSSELNLKKFIVKRDEHREKIKESLSKRFGFTVKNDILSDIVLYKSIEKRGFLIVENGVQLKCLNHITLDGTMMIRKS